MTASQEDLNQFLSQLADFLQRCYPQGFERLTLERESDVLTPHEYIKLTLYGLHESELVLWSQDQDISVGGTFSHMHLYSAYQSLPEVMKATVDVVFDILRGVCVSYAVFHEGESGGGGFTDKNRASLEHIAAHWATFKHIRYTVDEVHVHEWGKPVVIQRRQPPGAA